MALVSSMATLAGGCGRPTAAVEPFVALEKADCLKLFDLGWKHVEEVRRLRRQNGQDGAPSALDRALAELQGVQDSMTARDCPPAHFRSLISGLP